MSKHTALDSEATSKPNRLLVRARFNAGLSQTELAKRAGVSRQTVVGAEKGLTRVQPRTAKSIADVLDVRATDLFTLDDLDLED